MSKSDSRYAWLDQKIEDHKKFIEKCKQDIIQNQQILKKVKTKIRKEDKDVTENC